MTTVRMRQVLDWRAAAWAALASGLTFFILSLILSAIFSGSPWVYTRLMASVLMGSGVLPPPAPITFPVLLVGFVTHAVLSGVFAIVVTVVIHRWGMLVGIIGGGILGLSIYLINFFAMALLLPWFSFYRGWPLLLTHVIFGAVAGGVYEALEVEEFVPVEAGG